MKVSDVYKKESKFFKAEDLNGKGKRLRIEEWEKVLLGKDDKIVLSFTSAEKKLVLNTTNAQIIERNLKSDDFDKWLNKVITIYPTTTSFEGRDVDCIRVRDEMAVEVDEEEAPPF